MRMGYNEPVRQRGGNRNHLLFLGLLALLLLSFGQASLAQRLSRAGAVRVVLPPGDVNRQRGTQVVRTTAARGMPVYYQDVLETGVGGRLRARLDDGSILALGSQSRVRVVEHNAQTQQSTLQLEYGKVRAQVVRLTRPGSRFEIRTNTAVAGVLGTDEIVDAFSPVATLVICIEGVIEVRNADPNVPGTVVLTAGQITIVQQGLAPTPARAATPAEIQNALEGSSGAAPQAVADIGTGFVTAGEELVLSGADSFATGTITAYQWILTRAADNVATYNQSSSDPVLRLDTTVWQPGNYNGTLTITSSSNQTATVNFGFVVLPAAIANTNPEQVIQQMQLAYETLQPTEFMKLFDPLKYSGYAALEQSVEASFRNLSQARVFVRKASGQIFEQGKVAIYQVDFEIHFSTKAEPDRLFVVREQATLRMESGSGWLISDVPQGRVGGGGLLAVPGVGNPNQVNTPPVEGAPGGVPHVQPQGERVVVLAGGSSGFVIQNTSSTQITINFDLPPGITLTGGGVTGTTFTIPGGETLNLTFSAAPGQPAGTVTVPTTLISGSSTLPGPTIPLTVFRLSLNFPGGGASAANPVPVLLGLTGSAPVQVTSTVSTGHTVALSGTGGQQVTAAFAPNPLTIGPGSSSGNSAVTLTPAANAVAGPDQVTVEARADSTVFSAPLFINRIAPFTFTRTSPASLTLLANQIPPQTGTITFNVNFNAPFSGPVQITAPAGAGGLTFSPPSVTVNNSGPVSFTATPGATSLPPTAFTFTASAGGFSQAQAVTINVALPLQIRLSATPSSLSLSPGLSGSVVAQVTFVSGTPQPVEVVVDAGSVDSNLLSVSGGDTLPEAAGSVPFTVTVQPNATPGLSSSFRILTRAAGVTLEQVTVEVTILPPLQCTLTATPASLSLAPAQNGQVRVDVAFVAGTPRDVDVIVAPGSVTGSLLAVSGGGTVPNASGAVTFTVAAQPNAPPGPTTFRVTAPSCASGPQVGAPAPEVQIAATILGSFSLSGPSTVSALQNQTVNVPIAVARQNGFNAPIELTHSCNLPDITASGPASLTPGQTSFPVAIAATSTATGPATCTVRGVSGTASSAVSFTVTAGAFSLSSTAPIPLPLFLGGTASLPVTVTPAPGFTDNVQLSVVASSGITVTPDIASVPGGNGTVTFTLSTTSAAQAGLGTVTVTGTAPGGLTAKLEQAVELSEGFSLSADPATFFLGNTSPLVVRIERQANFTGGVSLQVGTLPAGIVSITPNPTSVSAGATSVTFQVLASSNATLSGQSVAIPITGSVIPAIFAADAGRAISEPVAQLVTFNATGTLQAPFSVTGGGSLGSVDIGKSASGTVTVAFAGGFIGTVAVTTAGSPTGVSVSGGSGQLTADGSVSFTASPFLAGGYTVTVTAQAGGFSIVTFFNVDGTTPPPPPPPPPPPAPTFSLCVSVSTSQTCLSTGSPVNVNASIPVALQAKVAQGVPTNIAVTVQDGGVMKFYPGCGTPQGGVYSGGVLTFTASPNVPVSFCMAAGTPTQPASDSTVLITGTPVGGSPASITPAFQIGVPGLTVTPSTFTLPAAATAPSSQVLNIALAASSPTNVFSLPVTVFITGPNSFVTGQGPFLDPLPASIGSADCGPATSGKTISPGGSTTCTVTNSSTSTSFNSSGNLVVFVTFGPGGGGSVPLGAGGEVRRNQVSRTRTQGRADSDGEAVANAAAASAATGLVISPESIQVSPLLPKEGDTVSIRARLENRGAEDAEAVAVALVVNKATVASQAVSVPAGGSQVIEFQWEAAYDSRLSAELSIDPEGRFAQAGESPKPVGVRNLFVEPAGMAAVRQGRSSLEVTNGNCAGFRFVQETQSFCGGSSDIELSPTITADGQLRVQVLSLNGGIVDLGPRPVTGSLTAPETGYAARGWLEAGRLYAVESQGKYSLLYVARIQSEIDPRLARLMRGQQARLDGLDDLLSDRLDDLLDQSRITVEFEWAYLENGSRRFSYGFTGGGPARRPGLYRQPRVPAPSAKE